jgi:hypothetical protein
MVEDLNRGRGLDLRDKKGGWNSEPLWGLETVQILKFIVQLCPGYTRIQSYSYGSIGKLGKETAPDLPRLKKYAAEQIKMRRGVKKNMRSNLELW